MVVGVERVELQKFQAARTAQTRKLAPPQRAARNPGGGVLASPHDDTPVEFTRVVRVA
jgi:hypothetical protein